MRDENTFLSVVFEFFFSVQFKVQEYDVIIKPLTDLIRRNILLEIIQELIETLAKDLCLYHWRASKLCFFPLKSNFDKNGLITKFNCVMCCSRSLFSKCTQL